VQPVRRSPGTITGSGRKTEFCGHGPGHTSSFGKEPRTENCRCQMRPPLLRPPLPKFWPERAQYSYFTGLIPQFEVAFTGTAPFAPDGGRCASPIGVGEQPPDFLSRPIGRRPGISGTVRRSDRPPPGILPRCAPPGPQRDDPTSLLWFPADHPPEAR
jgi:hypothetical protein